jgi:hypothetical protein
MNTVEVSNGMSVINQCYDCMTIADETDDDDMKCRVCDESDEARVDELAWNHRADERLSEGDVITDLTTPPSATEWVGSHTRQSDGRIRDEFAPATYNLADRCPGSYFLGKHIFDLDDDEQHSIIHFYEMICMNCNLVRLKRTGCQECV